MRRQIHESLRDGKGQSIILTPKRLKPDTERLSDILEPAILLLQLARFRPLQDNYICLWKIRDT